MGIVRHLDTSEHLNLVPVINPDFHDLKTTGNKTTASNNRPLRSDRELSRAEKNTERLRRKRTKRRELHKKQADLKQRANNGDQRVKTKLDKQRAYEALRAYDNVVIATEQDPKRANQRKMARTLFGKERKRVSLLEKDKGFGKR